MSALPFICLFTGIALGIFIKSKRFIKTADSVSTMALFLLMLCIGIGIGLDQNLIDNLTTIGLNCLVIALNAIAFSVLFVVICEKTVLPLELVDKDLHRKSVDIHSTDSVIQIEENNKAGDAGKKLIWVMPISLILGLIIGIMTRQWLTPAVVDTAFVLFLVILYICVGISQGANRDVFRYIKLLGFKVLWLSIAILVGSLAGGFLSGIVLNLPQTTTMIASGGMSFYSLTGAYMTTTYGLEVGAYGFIVNVMREFFTLLLMPILVKISKGSPIAGGAAGNMDTMLAPVTKFVGVRLGLVTLITGTVLTFIVPILLPILSAVLI